MPISKDRISYVMGHISSHVIQNKIHEIVDVHCGRKASNKVMFVITNQSGIRLAMKERKFQDVRAV